MTQNEMPKIERSVAYTFDAYAGENDHIKQTKKQDTTKSGIYLYTTYIYIYILIYYNNF